MPKKNLAARKAKPLSAIMHKTITPGVKNFF
jgi:hypothetical protein